MGGAKLGVGPGGKDHFHEDLGRADGEVERDEAIGPLAVPPDKAAGGVEGSGWGAGGQRTHLS